MNENKQNDKENEYLTEHEYDGIKECDYPLPSWWVVGFWLTIIFSIGYFVYYQLGPGPTLTEELATEMEPINAKKVASESSAGFNLAKFDDYFKNKEKLKLGEETYIAMCMACHKPLGGGDIGPNLSDNYWKNGDGSPESIYNMVKNGKPEGGMPAWGAILGDEKTYAAAAYVKSLKGAKPERPKAPEGTLFE